MGFPTKVQLIQRHASAQWYINFPSALAQALEFSRGETVEWFVEDKNLLALRRASTPPPVLKKLCRHPRSPRTTLGPMLPQLRPTAPRHARPNPLAEHPALSGTSYRDRFAHHVRRPVPGLDLPLPALFPRPSSRRRDLLRRPPRRTGRTASARSPLHRSG